MKLDKCKHIVSSLAAGGLLLVGVLLLLSGTSQPARAAPGALLFVTPGGSGDCSQPLPCPLQTALGQASDGDTIYVAGGIYTGTGSAVVTVTESIILYGGWDGTLSGPVVRDPEVYPSMLDGEGARRVVYISGDITPTLDGFTIAHGNATGLTTDCPGIHGGPAGCGEGIFVNDASALIVGNVITNNVAAYSGSSTGYGGGLYLKSAHGAVISGNVIISNVAHLTKMGDGGGLHLDHSNAQVRSNQILDNHATGPSTYAWGGGISSYSGAPTVEGNVLRGNWDNSAGVISLHSGAALYTHGDSGTYSGNQISESHGESAICLQNSAVRLEGNWVISNSTTIGVVLWNGGGAVTRLANNVIARSGERAVSAESYSTAPLTATFLHNTLVGSGTGHGVYVEDYVTLYLTNTIVTSHTWGITNTFPASSTVLADHTLFWANTNYGIPGSSPVDGDPRFVNPAGGDYHLGPGSAAMDAGVDAGITTDIDGDARPMATGYDIGADEYVARIYLPLVMR